MNSLISGRLSTGVQQLSIQQCRFKKTSVLEKVFMKNAVVHVQTQSTQKAMCDLNNIWKHLYGPVVRSSDKLRGLEALRNLRNTEQHRPRRLLNANVSRKCSPIPCVVRVRECGFKELPTKEVSADVYKSLDQRKPISRV